MHDLLTKEDFRAAMRTFELRVTLMIGIVWTIAIAAIVMMKPL